MLWQSPCTNFVLCKTQYLAKAISRPFMWGNGKMENTSLHEHCPETADMRPLQEELSYHPTFPSIRF